MRLERLNEVLKKYRSNQARVMLLRHKLNMLNRFLALARDQMVNDSVCLSQALTGMPGGSGTGDPTARLAVSLASGEVTQFVKELMEEISQTEAQLVDAESDVKQAERLMVNMTELEKKLMELRLMAELEWIPILGIINKEHHNAYSKRTLQRIYDRAMEKAEDAALAEPDEA